MIYRLYFNRCEEFPQIWSIDEGSIETEINVVDFRTEGHVTTQGGHAQDFSAVTAREPKAWVVVNAHALRIEHGVAIFADASSGT